jgi:hypothetical protein
MRVNETDPGGPIAPGSPLGRALSDYAVPPLSAGFADRVLAAAEARPAVSSSPLSPLRRAPLTARGWRLGRGVVIGVVSFGALASAAAATGLLERFDITVPTPQTVWASITGAPAPAPAAAAAPRSAVATRTGETLGEAPAPAPVEIVGPVDTPEELAEAFRRIEAVRQQRFAARSERIDQRIDSAIERRRAAGLPLPTPEEEAAFRQRIASDRARRDAFAADRLAQRREELAGRLESGEALTREDIMRPLREDVRTLASAEKLRKLSRMAPEERREALRQMPPEERRALVEAMKQWRELKAGQGQGAVPDGATEPAPQPSPPE